MNATELLNHCGALGITLAEGPDGDLLWEADDDLSDDLLGELTDNKAAVLELIARTAADTSVPRWDQTRAEHLLADLRTEVGRLETRFGGKPPATVSTLLADALTIGERYVREHEREAASGWDALELLQELVPHVRDVVARWRLAHPMNVSHSPKTPSRR